MYGAVFPTSEIGNDPIAIRDFAQSAEDLGYSHITIYDHILGATHEFRDPPLPLLYTDRDAFHEPFVLFGFLSAVTTKIILSTGVLVLPQRQTALVAKQAAEIDILSGERLRLGVGTGWNYVEYQALGVPFAYRGKRLEEQVHLLRKLWQDPLIDFTGEYHRVDRASIAPRPNRQIPIWFGGYSTSALRRAARIGDGFIFGNSDQKIVAKADELRLMLEAEGRTVDKFPMEVIVPFTKGPKGWASDRDIWADNGGTHFSMRAMSTGAEFLGQPRTNFETPAEHIKALETFITAIT
ncbi:MAG: LLM class F420-dependent oxidoreductase [bacterium]